MYANTYITFLQDVITLNNRILTRIQQKNLKTKVIKLYKSFTTIPVNKLLQLLLHAHTINYHPSNLPSIVTFNYHLNKDVHFLETRSSKDFHRILITCTFCKNISHNKCTKLCHLLPSNIQTEHHKSTHRLLNFDK